MIIIISVMNGHGNILYHHVPAPRQVRTSAFKSSVKLTIDNTKNIIISIMNGIELGYNLTYPSSIELLEKMFIS